MHAQPARIRPALTALVVALALAAAACSTGGGSDSAPTTTAGAPTTTSGRSTTTGGDGTTTSTDDATTTTTTDDAPTTTGDETTTTDAGGGVGDRDQYLTAIVDELGDGVGLSEDEARCVGNKIIDDLGLERLTSKGLSVDDFGNGDFADLDLTDGEATAVYDTFGDCGVDLYERMLAALGTGGSADCLESHISAEQLRTAMIKGFQSSGDLDANDPLNKAFDACISASTVAGP
jgi:hypothetical protein